LALDQYGIAELVPAEAAVLQRLRHSLKRKVGGESPEEFVVAVARLMHED